MGVSLQPLTVLVMACEEHPVALLPITGSSRGDETVTKKEEKNVL